MKSPRFPVVIATLALVACGACSASIPVPITGSHTRDEQTVPIPYPPPPARVAVVPPPPTEILDAVWVDGEWQWKGRRWVWTAGQWQAPLPGGYYAPPTVVRFEDGTIEYYAGTWKKAPTK